MAPKMEYRNPPDRKKQALEGNSCQLAARNQLGSPEFHRDLRLKSCILQILAPNRRDPRRLMGNPQVSADSSIVLCHINPYHISKIIKVYQREILMSFGYKSDRPKKLTRGRCCRRWDNVRAWEQSNSELYLLHHHDHIRCGKDMICNHRNIICVPTSATPISFRLSRLGSSRLHHSQLCFFWRISRSFGGKRGLFLPLTLGFFATWGWAWWSSWGV